MNRRTRKLLIAALLASLGTGAAWAHGGHARARVGVHVGVPLVGPGYWAPRPYYYGPRVWVPPVVVDPFGYPYGPAWYGAAGYYGPPVVGVPAAPPVYVEQALPPAAPAQSYWYWCADPQGYYPSVRECPGGWQAVAPQPAVQQ